MASTPRTSAAAAKAPVAPAKREFSFSVSDDSFVDSIPDEAFASNRVTANALPFVALFDKAEPSLAQGKTFKLDVPQAYFEIERETPLADKKEGAAAWMKSKLRDQFNKWVKGAPDIRGVYSMVYVWRDGSQKDHDLGNGPEPHLTLWVRRQK